MIAEIIPQIRLPKSIGVFDYKIPPELESKIKIGQIVTIPFRQRQIEGVVFNLKKTSSLKKKLASIVAVRSDQIIITKTLIALIKKVAKYYYFSPALLVKSVIPDLPRRSYKKQFKKLRLIPLKLKLPTSSLSALKKVTQAIVRQSSKPCLLHFNSLSQKVFILLDLINKFSQTGQQILLVVPELADIQMLFPIIKKKFPKTVYWHGQLAKNQQFDLWLKILKGQTDIIIGTRPAVFLPFKNLGLVIIDQEENESHKQYDQNPRYQVKKVIELLSELKNFKYVLTARSPDPTTYQQVRKGQISYHNIRQSNRVKVTTVNLNQVLESGNFTFLSDQLVHNIEKKLNLRQQTFLYVGQKGLSSRVFCSDCHHLFICPVCQFPLSAHSNLELVCHNCRYRAVMPKSCPNCHSVQIKFPGLGMEKIEQSLKKFFSKTMIKTINADNYQEQTDYSDYSILIGTQVVLRQANLPNLGMIGIINADSALGHPDFSSSFKSYSDLNYLVNFKKGIDVVIQTFNPDNHILKAIIKDDYKIFYQAELNSRQQFGYPPFQKLAKLIYQDKNKQVAEEKAQSLYQNLKSKKNTNWEINMLPASPFIRNQRYRYLIIIKYTGHLLQSFIKLIPDDWIIDIDPLNFN